ncbi:ADP-ribosylglycohydrolase family protein [Desulfonema magnum]|uniref:ADP-ribosylglycohydrolase family protein n=1 Tax=Desulfonema magnum TaxID=45655 RepID=A0A975GS65_9BACT|nr:ADP-ribosylglycohydrolase family protein [Desulfonema magnum]QTA90763.1 ADP-ribosylglycohydrolase family protein [Desulfonema magnum]
MIGAIAGDIIGSVFERHPEKTTKFRLFSPYSTFTDDTVLTVAIAYSILTGRDYTTALKAFGSKYPDAGYGGSFYVWMLSCHSKPYNSWGNGSAMRVSPVGFAFDSVEHVLAEAKKSAQVTHNHPEGIKGAQAAALSVFLARSGETKDSIREEISDRFDYDLNRTIEEIRPDYYFDVSCQGSVPEAIIAFLDSENFEDALRKGISLGGDSDTIACIAGGIAQAYYKTIPPEIIAKVRNRLPEEFLSVIDEFNEKYKIEFTS